MLFGIKDLYEKQLLPRLINFACSIESCAAQRAEIVPRAHGRILEIGFGSGLNIPFYDGQQVEQLVAIEPSAAMCSLARQRIANSHLPLTLIQSPAESLPLENDSFDTIVVTYTLCTLPDLDGAMSEFHRVLNPRGRVLFCEHGVDPNPTVQRWQNRIDPLWSRLFGGCHLNRNIPELLSQRGFRVSSLWAGNINDLRLASYTYRGEALPV